MRNKGVMVGICIVAITLSTAATSLNKIYLWHDGICTDVPQGDVLFHSKEGNMEIQGEQFALDQVDSMTIKTPKLPPTPSTIQGLNTTSSHDMTVKQVSSRSYKLVTTGSDPYICTNALTRTLHKDSCVLAFEYRLDVQIPRMKFFFANPLCEERSAAFSGLKPTRLWKKASYDLKAQRDNLDWGNAGEFLRIDPGDAAGVTLEIRNIYFRSATDEEIAQREIAEKQKTYIDNDTVRLGVDMERGASVFYFALAKDQKNLLNHRDEGRFIQQSYYGEHDGSEWWGQQWTWNPIQGGGSNGTTAKLKSVEVTKTSIHAISIPVHWAYGMLMPELEMEEMITLDGNLAHIHYTFRNNGEEAKDHPMANHEMPAVFVDANYPHLMYYFGDHPWTNAALTDVVPGWPNESHDRSEEWSAYVNDNKYGIGVYTPGSYLITAYRYGQGNSTGPNGDDCSYFAPLRQFAIKKGMVVEYDVYVTIGQIEEIRNRFYNLHEKTQMVK